MLKEGIRGRDQQGAVGMVCMGDGWAPERVGSGEVALARDTPRARQGATGAKEAEDKRY